MGQDLKGALGEAVALAVSPLGLGDSGPFCCTSKCPNPYKVLSDSHPLSKLKLWGILSNLSTPQQTTQLSLSNSPVQFLFLFLSVCACMGLKYIFFITVESSIILLPNMYLYLIWGIKIFGEQTNGCTSIKDQKSKVTRERNLGE